MKKAELGRILKFAVTGVLNTAVDWAVFYALVLALRLGKGPAQALGYLCGVANSWLWNSLWVFTDKPVAGSGDVPADTATSPPGDPSARGSAPASPSGDSPTGRGLPTLPRFLLATGTTTLATVGAMELLGRLTRAPLIADKALVTVLGIGVNYLAYSFWVFTVKEGS